MEQTNLRLKTRNKQDGKEVYFLFGFVRLGHSLDEPLGEESFHVQQTRYDTQGYGPTG